MRIITKTIRKHVGVYLAVCLFLMMAFLCLATKFVSVPRDSTSLEDVDFAELVDTRASDVETTRDKTQPTLYIDTTNVSLKTETSDAAQVQSF